MKKTNKLFAAFLLLGLTISGCSLLPNAISRRSKSSSQVQEVNEFDAKTHEIYELYLANGGTLTYEEWLESIKGAKGDKGDKGDTGATGATGAQGPKGDKGDQGNPGQDGQDGKDGVDGQDGKDGSDGTTPHIGGNGNWWIGEQDTGVCAGGQNGEPGVGISSIAFNGEGELVVTFDNGYVVNLGAIGSSIHQHEYEVETLDATCTTDGYYKFTCKTCGHIETVINKAQGHLFEAYREKVPATCTNEGLKSRKCTVCGYEETETIPAHDHTFSEGYVYDANKHWHYCTTCGVVQGEENHVFVDHTCSICSYKTSSNVSSDGLLFALNEDGASYAVISIGTYADTVLDIPSSYNGYPVTAIGYGAFQNSQITSVTIPNSITQIGANAFKGCNKLVSAILPSGLKTVPVSCFFGCNLLESIVVPDGVEVIENSAFYDCYALASLTLPNTLKYIGGYSFEYNWSLTSVVIPSSVSCINYGAFAGCRVLTNVVLNEGLKYLDWNVFDGCAALTSITIPSTVYHIGSSCFNGCSSLTSVVFKQLDGWQRGEGGDTIYKELIEVPEMAAEQLVGSGYEWHCKYVVREIKINTSSTWSLTAGDSFTAEVELIPSTATSPITYESSNEDVATVDENGVVTGVSSGVANILVKSCGVTAVIEVRVGEPDTEGTLIFYKISENEYAVALNNRYFDGEIIIPSIFNGKSVTRILNEGFRYSDNLKSVYVPSSIVQIGNRAFGNCYSLKTITFESAVPPQMGDDVFSGTWDYSDFKIMVPNAGLDAYKAITADAWQNSAIDNIYGY